MSDHISVKEARAVLELDSAPLPMRQAARTIVAKAEQIERLQAALKQAHEDEFIAGLDRYPTVVYTAPEGDEWVEDYPVLLPGDMETPEVEA